jgi:GntR family transcriptional regulator
MFVSIGARNALMKDERQRFLEGEWPKIYATIQRLGLSTADLLRNGAGTPNSSTPGPQGPGRDGPGRSDGKRDDNSGN